MVEQTSFYHFTKLKTKNTLKMGNQTGPELPSFSSLWTLLLSSILLSSHITAAADYSRADFPEEFVFGAGTSAYQYEGAAAEDGRSPSIWDDFTHSGKMMDKSTGDVAADGYHKYKEDIKLMSEMGLEAYRFSISWSRLLPNGRGAVNPKGLKYYNNVINELAKHGIEMHITLYHLDLPQVLEDEYEGWLSPKIVKDFKEYADVCFREFGDRVSHWTTIDEPNVVGQGSYDTGMFPPQRCSYPFGNCSAGNSTTEPYIAAHNFLLAHAEVYHLYKTKYQATQKGLVGMNVYSIWCYPYSDSSADIKAAQRVLDFFIGWIIDPLVYGDYPETLKKIVGDRLPFFAESEKEKIKGSTDFIALNHYTSVYVKDDSIAALNTLRDFIADMLAILTVSKADPPSMFVPTQIISDPPGLRNMLNYLKNNYGNVPIYIQENGYGLAAMTDVLNDTERITYLDNYIESMLVALRDGVDVRGYFMWSFVDVFEFLAGYQSNFGLYHVDFKDVKHKRQPKLSAYWYSKFLASKNKIRKVTYDFQGTYHMIQ